MKTLKVALVAMLAVFTLASLSSGAQVVKENPNFKKMVVMPIEKALKDPGLVKAMYLQTDRDNFINAHQNWYSVYILYKNNTYYITGSNEQWLRFYWYNSTTPNKKKLPPRMNQS
jgi:ADP-heptose:LPS heptosyltransferase